MKIINQYKWRIKSYKKFLKEYQEAQAKIPTGTQPHLLLSERIKRCRDLINLCEAVVRDFGEIESAIDGLIEAVADKTKESNDGDGEIPK